MDFHHTLFLLTTITITILLLTSPHLPPTSAGLLSEPVPEPDQPTTPNTVPAFPVQPDPSPTQPQTPCHLDLSNELFGGVTEACSHSLDRSRCCPVLAAWLYAAHARSALQLPPPVSPDSDSGSDQLPMMPESDSQKCVNSLQNSLLKHNIHLPQPNATCDTVLCFCGIRLHQIASLSCPAAFNVTVSGSVSRYRNDNATPTANVRNLEKNCRNSSYAGCTKCLGALQKLNTGDKNKTKSDGSRASKMFKKDCQLMGLTWLLARNKTAYIPTVSAVLRAMMYSAHPHESKCSPDQENMPLAVDSLQFYKYSNVASSPSSIPLVLSFLSLLLISFLLNNY
ncbi:putative GPI-anchored protein At4g28100 [Silene latifolia]|uniref:putative GPI-anchored protein At4g28100 n=1 Tax=Silene latifolia TaxID=37657 RepID=UPI003D773226